MTPDFKKARIVPADVLMNVRVVSAAMTGVQRYAAELGRCFGNSVEQMAPPHSARGWKGHAWEQLILPAKCGNRLLFSPGNTGPLGYSRQVVTIHDAATFDCANAFGGVFGQWYRWLLPRLAARVCGVITVSEFSRDRLVARLGVDRDRVVVIHNGVSPVSILPMAKGEEIANRLELPRRFLLFVGSDDPRKNLRRLVEGFVAAKLDNVQLLIAGGANPRLFAKTHERELPSGVRLLGRVTDEELETLYSRAEAFVFPSLYEGFGLPPLEAMARGCPVLCSSATCLPEVCGPALESGGACLYFDPSSVGEIAKALRAFAGFSTQVRQQMIELGRVHAAKFSWDRCARETIDFLGHCARNLPGQSIRKSRANRVSDQSLEVPKGFVA